MAKTKVHKGKNDQYKTTIPKALAEALELNGKHIEWKVKSARSLEVTRIDD